MYIGNEEFFSLPFYVDHRVLTPRNDTETMVYQVLKMVTPPATLPHQLRGTKGEYTFIDIGTGSSCIISSILKNIKYPALDAFGVDISDDALEVAKINRKLLGLENILTLKKSNLLELFLNREEKIEGKHLIITANLPYVKDGDIEHMDEEVLENDPHIALFGGPKTGFELYERLLSECKKLKEIFPGDITLFIEIGFDQYEYSKEYLTQKGYEFEYFKDLGGIWRIIKIYIRK